MASKVALVLSGGIALGAYQAGAYARIHDACGSRVHHLAGSSIGAVNAAIIAGNRPDLRVKRLREFWQRVASLLPPPLAERGPVRRTYNRLSALHARAFGRRGLFALGPPYLPGRTGTAGIYDLAPLRAALEDLVDFDLLNGAAPRFSATATDLASGEPVVYDTGAGQRIGPEHLVASCGFVPEFGAVEIDGRMLGDGGFVANAPVERVLGADAPDDDLICFVIDLFARDAERPASLEEAAARRLDLLFSNQTHRVLDGLAREHRLRRLLADAVGRLAAETRRSADIAPMVREGRKGRLEVLLLSYRANPDEAGPDKQFDFSPTTLRERWEAGEADMSRALEQMEGSALPEGAIEVRRIRR